jgi:hypothetical protein
LPKFEKFELPGAGLCWKDCAVPPKDKLTIRVEAPQESPCGQFKAEMAVRDSGGNVALAGVLRLDYTRTWEEFNPKNQTSHQIWRFVARVDLSSTDDVNVCWRPSCLNTFPTAYFYGYVDYAMNCESGKWENVIVLHHACDGFIHDPQLSDRPGVFHPGESFSLVAPDFPTNPFFPGSFQAPFGPFDVEAVRNVNNLFAPGRCTTEEHVTGNMEFLNQVCLCPPAIPGPQTLLPFNGVGTCPRDDGLPSSFQSLDLSPTFPWIHMVSHSIGSWSTDVSYPGEERVWVDEVVFVYHDSCAALKGPADFLDVSYGASTNFGWPVMAIDEGGGVLTREFHDLCSNYSESLAAPLPFPFVGSVFTSDHLIYVNTQ